MSENDRTTESETACCTVTCTCGDAECSCTCKDGKCECTCETGEVCCGPSGEGSKASCC